MKLPLTKGEFVGHDVVMCLVSTMFDFAEEHTLGDTEMKRQYLLDERDFRKYALLEDLAGTGLFGRMALFWMVTPDDDTGQGQSRTRDQSRPRLSAFFERFSGNSATFEDVADYFRALDLEVCSHESLYETRNASAYFLDIPDCYLENSVIFFDPDIGF